MKLVCKYEMKRVGKVANKRSHDLAVSAHDCIVTKTLRPNERLQVLSSFKVDQADNMDVLPQFSRSVRRGRQRYEAAEKAAQNASSESAETTPKE